MYPAPQFDLGDGPSGFPNQVYYCPIQLRDTLQTTNGQHYKVPHMRKMALAGAGLLPARLPCDPAIVNAAIEFLSATM